jgi:hypothetical protein
MLSQVKHKEIKILAIIGLFIAFSFTGLMGFSLMAGFIIGEMIGDILF